MTIEIQIAKGDKAVNFKSMTAKKRAITNMKKAINDEVSEVDSISLSERGTLIWRTSGTKVVTSLGLD